MINIKNEIILLNAYLKNCIFENKYQLINLITALIKLAGLFWK